MYDSLFELMDALERGPINAGSSFPFADFVEDKDGNVIVILALAGYPDDAIEIKPVENKIIVKTKDGYKAPKLSEGSKYLEEPSIKRGPFKASFILSETKYNFAAITAKRNLGELIITIPSKEKKVYNTINITN